MIVRYRPAFLLVPPLLVAAGIQASEFLVPKGVRDHLDKLEKDWEVLKKSAQEEKELSKKAQVASVSKAQSAEKGKAVDSKPVYIPIPIWTTQKKSQDYKADDKEWQEFVRLEQDAKRIKDLKNTTAKAVANAVLDGLPHHMQKAWGLDGQIKYDTGLIDFVFPFGPPPIHERPALMITTDGNMKWTCQKLPDERGRRFYRIFHPTVFASAFWAGGIAFYHFYYRKARAKALEILGDKPEEGTTQVKAKAGLTTKEKAEIKDALTISKPSTWKDLSDSAALLNTLVPPPAPKSALDAAVKAYRRQYTNLQVEKWKECPRGGCYLMGYVDIIGTKATIRVSVKAIYLPSQNIFLGSPTMGEAIVLPKVSLMTADLIKKEKLRTEWREHLANKTDAWTLEEEKVAKMLGVSKPKKSNCDPAKIKPKGLGSGEGQIKIDQDKIEKSKAEDLKDTKTDEDKVKIDRKKKGAEQGSRSEK